MGRPDMRLATRWRPSRALRLAGRNPDTPANAAGTATYRRQGDTEIGRGPHPAETRPDRR